jgi:hypothetical protein
MPDSVSQTALEMRRAEVAEYQNNIDVYTSILATLPSALPEHLEPYRNRTDKHVAIGEIENLDDVVLLSDVWHHMEVKTRIRTEMLEQRKSQAILTYLEANQ